MGYLPGLGVTRHDGGVVVGSYVYADGIVAGKLHNWIVGDDGEDEDGLAVLSLDGRESDFPLGEPLVVEGEGQPVPPPLGNLFQDNLAIGKRVALNGCVALIYCARGSRSPRHTTVRPRLRCASSLGSRTWGFLRL